MLALSFCCSAGLLNNVSITVSSSVFAQRFCLGLTQVVLEFLSFQYSLFMRGLGCAPSITHKQDVHVVSIKLEMLLLAELVLIRIVARKIKMYSQR